MKRDGAFVGQTAVVVGGSSGIGRAVGLALAGEGATVFFAGRNRDALGTVVDEAGRLGARAYFETLDVRDPDSVRRVARAAVERTGGLDLMFNGAGCSVLAYADETTLEDYNETIGVNLMGVVHGVHAAYPIMKQARRGHIVNVSSLAGLVPIPASAAYCAAKYGVVGLSQSLRLEGAEFGVKVSVVCPAAVRTPIVERVKFVNFDGAKWAASPPPGGLLTAEECARQVLVGIRKNRAVITPGSARAIATVSRHLPSLWQLAGRAMTRKLHDVRLLPRETPVAQSV